MTFYLYYPGSSNVFASKIKGRESKVRGVIGFPVPEKHKVTLGDMQQRSIRNAIGASNGN